MTSKTFAIITDIHSNFAALGKALEIIENHPHDQLICLGDCFALGPAPEKVFERLQSLEAIFIRGNHDRYLVERLWEQERPSLEGMDPDDPVCQAIVANEKWTAEQVGEAGADFIRSMHISHREVVGNTFVEFTHAWYERDDEPPTLEEAVHWRDHVQAAHPEVDQFIFIHGHVHHPRDESAENLKVLCQGATGMPFDEDPRGAVAFLTIGEFFEWDVIRFDYDKEATIQLLDDRKPPFYQNLKKTVLYAAIRNDD
ncbi:MAG: metallophosphoesterase [Candidatus Neomarinimicrobiota bacterium]|nr:MAG: metallophosphoesterase [Candidatus Neomarinimicrobiota bacterium]